MKKLIALSIALAAISISLAPAGASTMKAAGKPMALYCRSGQVSVVRYADGRQVGVDDGSGLPCEEQANRLLLCPVSEWQEGRRLLESSSQGYVGPDVIMKPRGGPAWGRYFWRLLRLALRPIHSPTVPTRLLRLLAKSRATPRWDGNLSSAGCEQVFRLHQYERKRSLCLSMWRGHPGSPEL